MNNAGFAETLKQRTKNFALSIVAFCKKLPQTYECSTIGHQLFRSGTSVGSNYRAACRGRSEAEFISKISIVIEEADESAFWLETLIEAKLCPNLENELMPLLNEANELVSIFVTTRKTINEKKVKSREF